MIKFKIVLVDSDERYLLPLERKFVEKYENKAEIIAITEEDYKTKFFSTPQSIDILIINEKMYDNLIERHNIANIYILEENSNSEIVTDNMGINKIYKYTSVKEIFNTVANSAILHESNSNKENKETKIVCSYSPIGGSGKTTVSIGLCGALAKIYKKVLFIGIDNLQTYGYFFQNINRLDTEIEKKIKLKSENIIESMQSFIIQDTFHIVPPFSRSLTSLNIKIENILYFINEIKKTNQYDYIVIDTSSDFTSELTNILTISDKIIITAEQDLNSVYKLECITQCIDCSSPERFLFVCNKYNSNMENYLAKSEIMGKIKINEYINYVSEFSGFGLTQLNESKLFDKLAYAFE